jgi:hypothetical protein
LTRALKVGWGKAAALRFSGRIDSESSRVVIVR